MLKIICSKASLQKSINISLRAVPSKTTMNILECVLVDASSNKIRFITNDMELGIETIVEGNIVEKGIVALDAKLFSEIIRKLPDDDVSISVDDRYTTQITCGKANFTIPGRSGEDFVYLPILEKDDVLTISQFALREMIRQTIFSIAVNESNRLMTGELFEIKDNILRLVSLDGHRISIRRMPLKRDYKDHKVILPGKTLNEIMKILVGDVDESVNIYFTENHILFETEDTMIVSRLIDGDYFRIDQMISNDYETHIRVNRRVFLECMDRSTLFAREGEKRPIILSTLENQLLLHIDSSLGSMNEEFDIEKEGKDITIGFNPRFLMDALKVIDEDEVDIYLVNSKSPCFIRDFEEKYVYLILPININNPS